MTEMEERLRNGRMEPPTERTFTIPEECGFVLFQLTPDGGGVQVTMDKRIGPVQLCGLAAYLEEHGRLLYRNQFAQAQAQAQQERSKLVVPVLRPI